jgi:hypothetical protein
LSELLDTATGAFVRLEREPLETLTAVDVACQLSAKDVIKKNINCEKYQIENVITLLSLPKARDSEAEYHDFSVIERSTISELLNISQKRDKLL